MDKHELDSYVRAGEIHKEVKKFARDLIKPGMKLIEIADAIDSKIYDLGAETAFPVNLSIDEIAAHFTPDSSCEEVARGLLKVDIGIAIDGYIADSAFSLDFSEDGGHKEMIELNTKVLRNVEAAVKPGVEVRLVGETVQDTVDEWNEENGTKFAVIKSLSGHQLGHHIIHAGLTISNYRNENSTEISDMAVAIEPFITTGVGDIYEGKAGGIYALQSDGNVRDREARKVLDFIKEKYKTRPFCLRFLEKEGFSRLRFVMKTLVDQGIVHEYPLLIEKSKAPVSQMENTFVVLEDGVRVTTRDWGYLENG